MGSVTIPNSVTSIGDYAFADCRCLTSITIPNSVLSIGEKAFRGCVGELIINTNALGLYGGWFTKLTIGDSVTSIGNDAFSGCSSLESVTIPSSVTSIGYRAFAECRCLTSITIPDSVIEIGKSAFYGCRDLTSFYGKYASADNRCLIVDGALISFAPAGLTEYPIPFGVTSIGDSVFSGCSSLAHITVSNSVTTIGESTFSGCKGLKTITIPNSVIEIKKAAFAGCTGELIIDSKIVETSYTAIYYEANYPTHKSWLKDAEFRTITIGNSVTKIGDCVFYYYRNLQNINIPNSVTSIGNYAFECCSNLFRVNIPNSVTSIGKHAFNGCERLISMSIPNSVTKIGDLAFCASTGELIIDTPMLGLYGGHFTELTIGDSVTEIEAEVFKHDVTLREVTIGNSVVSIGESAFEGCDNLRTITIPKSVKSIGKNAFYECGEWAHVYISDLSAWCNIDFGYPYANPLINDADFFLNGEEIVDLSIPSDVTSISFGLFAGCRNLQSVTIPSSVTYIGYSAFADCRYLKSIYCESVTPPTGEFNMFENSPRKIYVPSGSEDAYRSAEAWMYYADYIVGYNF